MTDPRAPLRLLFDGHTFDAGPQGTTTFLAGLLNALPAAAAPRAIEIHCAAASQDAVDRFVKTPYRYHAMRGGFARRNLIELPRISAEVNPDFIVSQYVRPFRGQGRKAAVIHDVLFMDYPHLFSRSYRLLRKTLFGWSARHSDLVLTVSDYSAQRIAHHFGIDQAAIAIVPNAVEVAPAEVQPETARSAGFELLYVSRFEARKRQDWCIRAAEQLHREGLPVRLTLVGAPEGAYGAHILDMAAAADVPVECLHGISNARIAQLYRDADLSLFPSECEGFGIPVIEAAALGTPCTVADNSALSELREHYAGDTFATDDFEGFLSAIRTGLNGREELRRRAAITAPGVREFYRWDRMAGLFLAAIEGRHR